MAATTALREALNEGISSGSLVDTKLILYSRRDSSGRVCRPKALYANSHVLKTVPYFNDCERIAILDTSRIAAHRVVSECSLGISQSHGRKTLRNRSMQMDPQTTTDTRLTATLKIVRVRRPSHPNPQHNRRSNCWNCLKMKGLSTKATRNGLKRGKWSRSRIWHS